MVESIWPLKAISAAARCSTSCITRRFSSSCAITCTRARQQPSQLISTICITCVHAYTRLSPVSSPFPAKCTRTRAIVR